MIHFIKTRSDCFELNQLCVNTFGPAQTELDMSDLNSGTKENIFLLQYFLVHDAEALEQSLRERDSLRQTGVMRAPPRWRWSRWPCSCVCSCG